MITEEISVFPMGEANDAYAEFFVGQSFLNMLSTEQVKHWHGAAPDSWFQHLAVEVPGERCGNEWCEPVSDEIYKKLK